MQVGILGPLTVSIDGRNTPVAGARLRSLVTRLALDAPKVVPADELIDALWADEPPADQANALQSLVSRARRILGPGSLPAVGAGYRLAVDRDDVDVHRFVQLARAGSEILSTDPARARPLLTEALELWRGDPLADARGADYALAPTARLGERRLDCLADRLTASLALGEVAGVVAEAQELASANPLAERLTALHMRALAAAGRPAEALALFQHSREYLADTLGADPSRELQQLHLELLRGEPTPAATHVPQGSVGNGSGSSAANIRRDNLPAAVTSFLGRDAELERLGALLEQSRMVTVIGPGGVGKTRLAVEIANRSRAGHSDGVWLVPLAPVTDPAGLAPAFLDALRLRNGPVMDRRDSGPRDVTERLLTSLADADALLVVDNCEHLITDVAALVGAIAERCPRVKIVATSREPLGLLGESLCPVPPLAVPRGLPDLDRARQTPAVRLLEERARAVRADFKVDDASLPAVLEIVERLDGLPLAIELAAARLRLLPATEVAALLSDRFRLLTGGNRAALPRHRTLWAVVDWSWNLLTDAERLAAERMSVFAGPWSVSAAVAVCADLQLDRAHLQDVLLSLADKSLLDTVDGVQFRMLETIREFAIVRSTESGRLDTARRVHAGFYEQTVKAMAARMRGSSQLIALRQLQADHADIQDAIRFLTDAGKLARARTMAAELIWFWIVTDRGHDVQSQLLDLVAREPADEGPTLQLEAFCMLNELAVGMPTEDISRQRAQAVSLAARMQASGPHRGEIGLMELLLNFFAGNYSRAKMLADGLVASSTNRWLRGATQMMRAAFAENFGEMDEMRRGLDAAWAELANHPDRWARAAVTGMRAKVRIMDGDIDGAIADLQVALQVAVEIGGMDDELQSRLILAQLHARRGEFSLAHQQFDTMTARWQEHGHSSPTAQERWQTSMLVGRLFVHEMAGNDECALAARDELLGQLRGLTRRDGHLTAIAWALIGCSLARTGDFTQAQQALATAYPVAMITEDQPVISTVGEAVAWWAARSGHPEQAAEILGAAARLRGAQDVNDPIVAAAKKLARDALGDKEFTAAFERGQALSRKQAFARIDPSRPINDPVAPDDGTTGSEDTFEAWVYPTGR
ncbi:MAG: AfsR/SARP family transcriptional regulator [Nakamurella sp.]